VEPDEVGAKIAAQIRAEFDRGPRNVYRNVRAILVSVGGRPVMEQYYQSSPTETRNVYSVTKSVLGTLIGIALSEGRLRGVDQPLTELLPAHTSVMKPPVPGITLRQVLTMTAGLPDDPDIGLPPFVSATQWIRSIVSAGTERQPGSGFGYSSAGSHLLSAILVQATGQSVLEYARAKLFDPLDIQTRPAAEPLVVDSNLPIYNQARFAWSVDPQGYHLGYSDLKLAPRDMAKLGALYLDQGRFQDKQIVPANWVREGTTAHTAAGTLDGYRYGYHWWVTTGRDHPAFAAIGFGGQLIEVVPDQRLVVVASTEVNENDLGSTIQPELLQNLVDTFIVPAVAPLQ
jgi:CubicO group peptidase (beta-lactamase class C family)